VSLMVWEIDSWVSKRVPSKSKMVRSVILEYANRLVVLVKFIITIVRDKDIEIINKGIARRRGGRYKDPALASNWIYGGQYDVTLKITVDIHFTQM
jgi:hypothetical protein